MDMVHKVLQIARIDDSTYGTLHRLPLPVCPRILDLGCGTGIWAIDIAEYVIQKHLQIANNRKICFLGFNHVLIVTLYYIGGLVVQTPQLRWLAGTLPSYNRNCIVAFLD